MDKPDFLATTHYGTVHESCVVSSLSVPKKPDPCLSTIIHFSVEIQKSSRKVHANQTIVHCLNWEKIRSKT